jgi:dihydrofolate reductase
MNHVTLDGVLQAPGRPDEDRRDGFEHGGWAATGSADAVVGQALGTRMQRSRGLLLGRRTYEDLLSFWNTQDSPFKDALNNAPKYVVSTTLREPAPWPNTTVISGDVTHAVDELKRQEEGGELQVMGSGELIQTLLRGNLIDEYMLVIHPLVLGSGRRLFPRGTTPNSLRLVDCVTGTSGVVIATYVPASAEAI